MLIYEVRVYTRRRYEAIFKKNKQSSRLTSVPLRPGGPWGQVTSHFSADGGVGVVSIIGCFCVGLVVVWFEENKLLLLFKL